AVLLPSRPFAAQLAINGRLSCTRPRSPARHKAFAAIPSQHLPRTTTPLAQKPASPLVAATTNLPARRAPAPPPPPPDHRSIPSTKSDHLDTRMRQRCEYPAKSMAAKTQPLQSA